MPRRAVIAIAIPNGEAHNPGINSKASVARTVVGRYDASDGARPHTTRVGIGCAHDMRHRRAVRGLEIHLLLQHHAVCVHGAADRVLRAALVVNARLHPNGAALRGGVDGVLDRLERTLLAAASHGVNAIRRHIKYVCRKARPCAHGRTRKKPKDVSSSAYDAYHR